MLKFHLFIGIFLNEKCKLIVQNFHLNLINFEWRGEWLLQINLIQRKAINDYMRWDAAIFRDRCWLRFELGAEEWLTCYLEKKSNLTSFFE